MINPVFPVSVNKIAFRGEQPQQTVTPEKSEQKSGGNRMLYASLAALGTLGAAGIIYCVTRGRGGSKNITEAGSKIAGSMSENTATEAKKYITADMFKDEDLAEAVRRYSARRNNRPIDLGEPGANMLYFFLRGFDANLYKIYLEKLAKCKTPEEVLAVKNAIMQKNNIPGEVLECANNKKAEEWIARMTKDEEDVVFPDNATPQEKFKILFDRSIEKTKGRAVGAYRGLYLRELEEAIKNNDKELAASLYSELMHEYKLHLDFLS